jgi:GTPase SAR1 family protein
MTTLSIKKNNSPTLKTLEMLCDGGLADKLNKYDLTSFMNTHATNLFIGRPGSGKTSLLYSFFKSKELFAKVYHNIFLFQPSASRSSMKDKLFDKLPDENKYEELSFENLNDVMTRIKDEDKEYNNCIIFDDMGAYLKNKETKQLLKELIYNRRHLRTSIFFLVQTYLSIEKDIRKLFSNIFVFKVSKKELETIFEEVVEREKDNILPISRLVYDKPYEYLFINTDTGRLFKKFDEILME